MDVGIGLPNALEGVRGRALVDWAAAAEDRGFAVLGTIGRSVFDTHEELMAFAAAAAVTERIALMSTVMVAPARQPALLAKQVATLDHIAEGRFRLGMGAGGRRDDYVVMDRDFDARGALFDAGIDKLRAAWRGEALDAQAVRCPLLRARRRRRRVRRNVSSYYAFGGPAFIERTYDSVLRTPDRHQRGPPGLRRHRRRGALPLATVSRPGPTPRPGRHHPLTPTPLRHPQGHRGHGFG